MVINEQFLEDYDGRTLPWARPAGSPSVLAPALLDLAVVVEMVFYVVAVLAVPGPNGEDQGGPTASASKQSWAGSFLVGQTTREQSLLTVQPCCSATGDRILSVSGRTLTFMRGYIASNQTDAELLTPSKPRGAAVPFILRVQCSRGDRRRLRASPNRHADEH